MTCDSELSSQLKSAAYSALMKMAGEIQEQIPALMSGAGHDAMAMHHLTQVCSLLLYSHFSRGTIHTLCFVVIICKNWNRLGCFLSAVVEA